MATHKHSTPARQIDWPTLIPTIAPLAVYGIIATLVALLAE